MTCASKELVLAANLASAYALIQTLMGDAKVLLEENMALMDQVEDLEAAPDHNELTKRLIADAVVLLIENMELMDRVADLESALDEMHQNMYHIIIDLSDALEQTQNGIRFILTRV